MPKPVTTAALTLVSNEQGRVALGLNAKAGAGAQITEWSIDWGDGEEETNTAALPTGAAHAYVSPGVQLVIFSVKDSKNKVASTGLNVVVTPTPIPVPPEEGTFDALIPPSDSGALFAERAWQYQQMSAPLVVKR